MDYGRLGIWIEFPYTKTAFELKIMKPRRNEYIIFIDLIYPQII